MPMSLVSAKTSASKATSIASCCRFSLRGPFSVPVCHSTLADSFAVLLSARYPMVSLFRKFALAYGFRSLLSSGLF